MSLTRKMKCSLTETQQKTIADKLHGFVGADIAALCSEAGVNAVRRYSKVTTYCGDCNKVIQIIHRIDMLLFQSREHETDSTCVSIQLDDFLHALPLIKPSALREVQIEVPKV